MDRFRSFRCDLGGIRTSDQTLHSMQHQAGHWSHLLELCYRSSYTSNAQEMICLPIEQKREDARTAEIKSAGIACGAGLHAKRL